MKTTLKQLAEGTFIVLLLIVGNVKAEGTEKIAATRAVETSLQLEKWMINETIWNPKTSVSYEYAQETEAALQFENWMTSDEVWNMSNSYAEETEIELNTENWMTSEKIWNRNNNFEETETEMKVETWMKNETVWNR